MFFSKPSQWKYKVVIAHSLTKYTINVSDFYFLNGKCKDQIWNSNPTDRWTESQKTQNNEFVKNKLENWVLMNQTDTKVDLDDKKM